jgi:hypothetical protein
VVKYIRQIHLLELSHIPLNTTTEPQSPCSRPPSRFALPFCRPTLKLTLQLNPPPSRANFVVAKLSVEGCSIAVNQLRRHCASFSSCFHLMHDCASFPVRSSTAAPLTGFRSTRPRSWVPCSSLATAIQASVSGALLISLLFVHRVTGLPNADLSLIRLRLGFLLSKSD